jgi:alpha-L-fucosidase 2
MTSSLFSICSNAMQVDGALGMTAAIAEMLLQSDGGELQFLPALPASWNAGEVAGLRARGGFELDFSWDSGRLRKAAILSHLGKRCRIRMAGSFAVTQQGKPVAVIRPEGGLIEFRTAAGDKYSVERID